MAPVRERILPADPMIFKEPVPVIMLAIEGLYVLVLMVTAPVTLTGLDAPKAKESPAWSVVPLARDRGPVATPKF